MKRFFFKKKCRLISYKQFNLIFKYSKKYKTDYIDFFIKENDLSHPRIGLIVSKKFFRKSHVRNRIKRLIRESFRLNQYILSPTDFILIVKKNLLNISNREILNFLEKIWSKYNFNKII